MYTIVGIRCLAYRLQQWCRGRSGSWWRYDSRCHRQQGVVSSARAGIVVVNGITFSTAGTSVKIDDNPSTADLLKPGMIVTVKGSSDDAARTGTAAEIEVRDALEGTISTVGANTITVMGQTVRIEDNSTAPPPTDEVSATVNGLVANTTYFWKVVADDGKGGLAASETFSFKTL